jgi:microcystin-dependent protein
MALKRGRAVTAANLVIAGSIIPPGTEAPFAGGTVPTGWFLEDGRELDRVQFSALFAAIGTRYGAGNGTTTFNIPDPQGNAFRAHVNINTITGSGTVASNNATFTAHGINRTGFKVRLNSGALSGLVAATTYYVIRVDANTLAFASTYANAIAGTKLAITGANTAVLIQFQDPDRNSRQEAAVGGATAGAMGSRQEDAVQHHGHDFYVGSTNSGFNHLNTQNQIALADNAGGRILQNTASGSKDQINTVKSDGTNGTPRTALESRMANETRLFIIKY